MFISDPRNSPRKGLLWTHGGTRRGCCRPTPCDDDGMLVEMQPATCQIQCHSHSVPARGASLDGQGSGFASRPHRELALSKVLSPLFDMGGEQGQRQHITDGSYTFAALGLDVIHHSRKLSRLSLPDPCSIEPDLGPRRGKHELKAPLLQSQPPLPPKNEKNSGGDSGSAAFPIPQPTRASCPNPFRPLSPVTGQSQKGERPRFGNLIDRVIKIHLLLQPAT